MRTGFPVISAGIRSSIFPRLVSQKTRMLPSSKTALMGFLTFSLIIIDAREILSIKARVETMTRVALSFGIATGIPFHFP